MATLRFNVSAECTRCQKCSEASLQTQSEITFWRETSPYLVYSHYAFTQQHWNELVLTHQDKQNLSLKGALTVNFSADFPGFSVFCGCGVFFWTPRSTEPPYLQTGFRKQASAAPSFYCGVGSGNFQHPQQSSCVALSREVKQLRAEFFLLQYSPAACGEVRPLVLLALLIRRLPQNRP